MERQEKKIKIITIIETVITIMVLCAGLIGVLVYGFGIDNRLTQMIEQIIPYPAAIINGTKIIPIDVLQSNLRSVKRFYENQNFSEAGLRVDFTTDNGKKRLLIKKKELLSKLVENKIIEILAAERNIIITEEAVTREVDQELAKSVSKNEALNNIKNLYGWDIGDFKKKLVKPDMYQAELEKYVLEKEINTESYRTKIEDAFNELKNKQDFSEVAKKYSEGESAKNGGDLGWLSADQILSELVDIASALPKKQNSDIIESALGFHIINVDDRKNEESIDKIKIKQIFIKKPNFSDWLLEQEKKIKVSVLLKGFFWNSEAGEVEFSNAEMKSFEEAINKNSTGDPSVF
jgi:parvulin-like peptidyl-prolyl isomerase